MVGLALGHATGLVVLLVVLPVVVLVVLAGCFLLLMVGLCFLFSWVPRPSFRLFPCLGVFRPVLLVAWALPHVPLAGWCLLLLWLGFLRLPPLRARSGAFGTPVGGGRGLVP